MHPMDVQRSEGRAPDGISRISSSEPRRHVTEIVPDFFKIGNLRFMPLVRDAEFLNCKLRILFLRRDPPGSVTSHGDIDNRIKTLIDALSLPDPNQMPKTICPGKGEDPFFVLMEDDNLLAGMQIDTHRLLGETSENSADSVKLIIDAEVKPYHNTMGNLSFT